MVCIDPGHPSEVGRGTSGRRSTEIGVAWGIAQDLQQRLEKRGFKVVMTKAKPQQMVRNRARAEIANRAHADLVVRLHCDAGSGSGFAVYYPSQSGTVNGTTGPSKAVILVSRTAATAFHRAMSATLKGSLPDNGLKTDLQTAVGAKQGALTGSIFSQAPVLLVEMVVLPNPTDEDFILSASGHRKMCDALENGVLAVIHRRPHP